MSIRIIIADDHTIVRHGLTKLLQQEKDVEVVAQAQNGHATLELARELSPDVIVMDVGMPDLNGIDATQQILHENPNIKVLALSMHAGKKFVVAMLKAGASGYLLKDCALEELTTALQTIISGRIYLSPAITDIVVDSYVRQPGEAEQSAFSVLSQREREVLQLMAEGNTTKQIALRLHISPKTVEGHRLRLMSKLNIDNIAQLTKYAIQEGLTSAEL
ncbi:MAG: response regulator transcription factor [Sedimentisphaerales bacterium]|jgi:DNA-binding NarL/FixJ family response regulator|nr:response regulator transcription factor [Sedimentisphaerales bacterium]HNY76941.1 response regulator transcription factor [Sedimentisphaerales bacterium]HOC62795.1 response regulator transcription factor [Sedimentisphaerales bacterium]HOH62715.1 response regulator transcription factor [Sedimentisphaerales bacterium]HPY48987.1 response regulator transcription factor [Sedimentisphaerales bacterium]